MLALARIGQPAEKGLPWALPERGMVCGIINLIQVFAEPVVEFGERPSRQAFRVHGLGNLPDVPHNLGISLQVVHELGVVRTQEAFDQGSKPCLRLGGSQ